MNTTEINLQLTIEEHEVVLDAINSYYDIVCTNLPLGAQEIFPSDHDCIIRFNALTTIRKKVVNNWSARFGR